jgi:hypothetical protein
MITDIAVFNAGQPFPPTDGDEVLRIDRYRQNILLYRNQHDEYAAFGEARLTLRPELAVAHKIILGYHERLTTHWHDLVFGEDPVPLVDKQPASGDVVSFIKDSHLVDAAREVIIDVSALGDGLFKVRRDDEGVILVESQQPEYWYPVVRPNDIRAVQAHVLAWKFSRDERNPDILQRFQGITTRKKHYVQLEIHRPGEIETRVHSLDDGALADDVTDQFIEEGQRLIKLDFPEFLLVHVPNKRTSRDYYGTDDYTKLDSIVIEMEDRLAQVSRILDKHADPSVYGPLSALTLNPDTSAWEFKTKGYIAMNDKDDPVPGYLAWDGQLEAALGEFNLLFTQLLLISETSPAAFGVFGEVPPVESGIALKRLLRTDLAKAARLQTAFAAAFAQVLRVATALSDDNVEVPEAFSWMFRDGLPDDPMENSTIAGNSIIGGFMSQLSAIKFLHPTWTDAQVEAEMENVIADELRKHEQAIELALASKGILPTPDAGVVTLVVGEQPEVTGSAAPAAAEVEEPE